MQTEQDLQRRRQQAEEYAARKIRSLPNPFSNLKISGPSNSELDTMLERNPEMRDIAIGEDYGKSRPGLYRISQQGDNVNINPLRMDRQPWDERLPDGRSVQDLLRGSIDRPSNNQPRIRPSVMPDVTAAPSQSSQPSTPSPRIAVSSQPSAGILGSLNLPQPNEINDVRDIAQPSESITAPPTSPVVGPSVRGMGKLDRDIMLREALSTADPESRVRIAGDQVDVSPPGMGGVNRRGRFATAGESGLNAFGSGDPDRPLYSLGQGLGAAITGLVSPRAGAKINRRFDLSRLDNDIERGVKMETEQAQLDRMRNPAGQTSTRVVTEGEYPGIEAGTEIRIRVDPRTGSVTDVVGPNNRPVISDVAKRTPQGAPHYESDADGNLVSIQGGRAVKVRDEQGQPIKVRSKNAAGEVVEVEVNGRSLRVTPGQALDYYGAIGAREDKRGAEDRERESKYSAAKSEYDSLVAAEEDARKTKEAAYKALDEMRKIVPDDEMGRQDLRQATKAAEDADAFYRTFGDKKKDAGRRMLENEPRAQSASQPYAGRTMSVANLARYAKDKGISEDEARRQVEAQGVRVQ